MSPTEPLKTESINHTSTSWGSFRIHGRSFSGTETARRPRSFGLRFCLDVFVFAGFETDAHNHWDGTSGVLKFVHMEIQQPGILNFL